MERTTAQGSETSRPPSGSDGYEHSGKRAARAGRMCVLHWDLLLCLRHLPPSVLRSSAAVVPAQGPRRTPQPIVSAHLGQRQGFLTFSLPLAQMGPSSGSKAVQ
jgi:hypothetical protein